MSRWIVSRCVKLQAQWSKWELSPITQPGWLIVLSLLCPLPFGDSISSFRVTVAFGYIMFLSLSSLLFCFYSPPFRGPWAGRLWLGPGRLFTHTPSPLSFVKASEITGEILGMNLQLHFLSWKYMKSCISL